MWPGYGVSDGLRRMVLFSRGNMPRFPLECAQTTVCCVHCTTPHSIWISINRALNPHAFCVSLTHLTRNSRFYASSHVSHAILPMWPRTQA